MSGRVAEVHAAPSMFVVDLPGKLEMWIGPERHVALAQPVEDAVEEVVINEEGEVLELWFYRRFRELQQHASIEQDIREGSPRRSLVSLEDLAVEARRGLPVAANDDQVVECDRNS